MPVIYDNGWQETGTVTGFTLASYTSNVSYEYETVWPTSQFNTTGGTVRYVYHLDDGRTYEWDQAPMQTVTYTGIPAYWESYPGVQPISQEEADRRLRETRERLHRNAIRRKRAVRKGQRLLLSMLSEVQKWEYAKKGHFTVCGADGNLYVLRKGKPVHQLSKNGAPQLSHCIHLPYSYIDEDSLVAIKLMLETDPPSFHKIAITTPLKQAAQVALAA